jgi:signal transduction histidine kinase
MDPTDAVSVLRHAIANPLSALLSEVQLALLDADQLSPRARESFQEIERLAIRLRAVLRASQEQSLASRAEPAD